ncbi:MAG: lactate racemase domain-containing protein [Microthrixaceae bacterium]
MKPHLDMDHSPDIYGAAAVKATAEEAGAKKAGTSDETSDGTSDGTCDGVLVAAIADHDGVLSDDRVRNALASGLGGRFAGESVLVCIPDHTRSAPLPMLIEAITELLADASQVDVLVALGTHPPLSEPKLRELVGLGDRPTSSLHHNLRLLNHAWQDPGQLATIGVLRSDEVRAIAGDLWHPSLRGDLPLRLNRAALEHDHIVILGPTFPHEVVGFSGGAKYLFPGISGPEMIDVSHWLGALCGIVGTIGIADTPPRAMIHAAARHLQTPVTLVALTVVEHARLAAVAIGDLEPTWRLAAELSAQRHITYLDRPMRRVLSVAPPMYDELWTAAKAMYKLEPVLAHGAELTIWAPHLSSVSQVHGADLDRVGYHVLPYFLKQWDRFADVPRAVLAHSTHLRGAGTFVDGVEHAAAAVTLASRIPAETCRRLGLGYADPDSIDPSAWSGQEDFGVLMVPHAGETLYRLRP